MFLGLDGAGKTCLLYRLKLGEEVNGRSFPIRTIGFNVETIPLREPDDSSWLSRQVQKHFSNTFSGPGIYTSISMTIWDVGGEARQRPLWRHYAQNTQLVVVVVDSRAPERFEESADAISKWAREAKGCAGVWRAGVRRLAEDPEFLIVATKQEPGDLAAGLATHPSLIRRALQPKLSAARGPTDHEQKIRVVPVSVVTG